VCLRNAGYSLGFLPVQRLPCRVVCVGNLTVGGTGKTPTVIALARLLTNTGRKVAILLRGYGRAGSGVEVVSDGRDLFLHWRRAGDEAVLLAKGLHGVPIVVGGDRVAAGMLAVNRFGPDTLLLDDGFQHRRLHRHLDLVMLDATDPFGGGRLLPRGRLREPVAALKRAHAVILSRTDQASELARLRRHLDQVIPGVPQILTRHRPSALTDLAGGERQPIESLRGRRVLAVSGIANPLGFHRTLTDLGAVLAATLAFPDHHHFGPADHACVDAMMREAGAELIVTTEKDAIRMPAGFVSWPIVVLRVELEITEGADVLKRLLMPWAGGADG
jgi:tetraacyldisaccharide 4'-kinase